MGRMTHPTAYLELQRIGVDVVQGDLADRQAVVAACHGCDIIFHVAAKAGVWGSYESYHRANVVGTENILAGCSAHGIRRLVYTSSPSVIFDGRDMEGVDERVPYPGHYEACYPKTKAIAEQMVLAANGPTLATVSLRPHLIWGPRDNHLVPRLLARAGSLRRIGALDKKVDSVYIDNAADAHVLAGDRLAAGSPVCGKAYFITNGEPRGVWELINGILRAGGQSPVTRRISRPAAMWLASLMEAGHTLFRIRREPRLTRFVVRELTTAHWFDISAARRDLGYDPRVSIDEGLGILAAWLKANPMR